MKQHGLEILVKLLKPATKEEIEEIVRARTGNSGGEQLTLADAGLEEEVRLLIGQQKP